ncbi:MAG: hypothetical protein EPN97_04485 [Alphaproteobacteria bacterium]|nr:MAG: hypothetical protein EPN97_04485 [Alphaproteobacteria bacterium]
MKDYSYFLAQGMSLEAFDTMKESKAEFESLKAKLCKKVGANDIMGGCLERGGRFEIVFFHFRADQKVPDGWKVNTEQRDQDGALQCTFAMPAPNTPDHFYMANMSGLMERAARHMLLEDIFGAEWFMRDVTAGAGESAFVRQKYVGDAGPKGKIPGPNPSYERQESPGSKTADQMAAMELDGKMYIRVANKPGTEEPICAPPDAQRVSYEDMLKADQAEWDRRNMRRYPPDICWGF